MRLEELQRQRKADGNPKARNKQQKQPTKKSDKSNKQKRNNGNAARNEGEDEEPQSGKKPSDRADDRDAHHNDLMMESMADVEFSSLTANASRDPSQAVDFGKPGSKTKRLKKLLDEAEAKRRRLEVLNASGTEGKALALNEQWSDAMKDVSGENTSVDTKKIKKALKKREKSKEKSARDWAVSC